MIHDMARAARIVEGGMILHVLNRGAGRRAIFSKDQDYLAFEQITVLATEAAHIEILAYCLMPNHWHFLLCPKGDHDLGRFMHALTNTHTRRWHEHYGEVGEGPLYQGRFKSFPVQDDEHFLTVARYIERNPLRAKLVDRAQDWPWSSLSRRAGGKENAGMIEGAKRPEIALAEWPVDPPRDSLRWINDAQTPAETEAVRQAIKSGRPFGKPQWQQSILNRFGQKT
jgi:putative transposase